MKYNFFKKLAAINMAAIVSLSAVAPTFAADDTNNSNEESSVSTDTSDNADDSNDSESSDSTEGSNEEDSNNSDENVDSDSDSDTDAPDNADTDDDIGDPNDSETGSDTDLPSDSDNTDVPSDTNDTDNTDKPSDSDTGNDTDIPSDSDNTDTPNDSDTDDDTDTSGGGGSQEELDTSDNETSEDLDAKENVELSEIESSKLSGYEHVNQAGGKGDSLVTLEIVNDGSGGGDDKDDPDNPGGEDDKDPDNPGGGDDKDPDNPGGGDDKDPDNPGGGDDKDPDNPGGGDDKDPEPMIFSAYVPSKLPMKLTEDGTVLTPSKAAIVNGVATKGIAVKDIEAHLDYGWDAEDWNVDYSSMSVNTKNVGLKLRGDTLSKNGDFSVNAEDWKIPKDSYIDLNMEAKLPPQKIETVTENSDVARLSFTLDWSGDDTTTGPKWEGGTINPDNPNDNPSALSKPKIESSDVIVAGGNGSIKVTWNDKDGKITLDRIVSSSTDVVTIGDITGSDGNKTATINGLKGGTSTITATLSNGETAIYEVIVYEVGNPDDIQVTVSNKDFNVGDSVTSNDVTASVPLIAPDGSTKTITVKPSINDNTLQAGNNSLTGTVTIGGQDYPIHFDVAVENQNSNKSGIQAESNDTFIAGESGDVKFTWDAKGNTITLTSITSSDESIATVGTATGADGGKTVNINALKGGTSIITATLNNGETATFEAKVYTVGNANDIQVTVKNPNLGIGDKVASNDITVKVPIISPDGETTFIERTPSIEDNTLKVGDNTITGAVTVGGQTYPISFDVTTELSDDMKSGLKAENNDMIVAGESGDIKFTWDTKGNTIMMNTVKSSNESVATIGTMTGSEGDKTVSVNGLQCGTSTITATLNNGETVTLDLPIYAVDTTKEMQVEVADKQFTEGSTLNTDDVIGKVPLTAPDGSTEYLSKHPSIPNKNLTEGTNTITGTVTAGGVTYNVTITINVAAAPNPSNGLVMSVAEAQAAGWTFDVYKEGVQITGFKNVAFKSSINVPNQIGDFEVLKVGDNVFQNQTNLKQITLPNSVTEIGNASFAGCSGLTSFNTNKVIDIGTGAFSGCTKISNLTIPKDATLGQSAFEGCTALTELSTNKLSSIGTGAFANCTGLKTLNLGDNLTSIGPRAFADCTNLTVLNTNNVESIGNNAFEGCSNLAQLNFDNNLTNIGNNAFQDCDALSNVTITNTDMRLGQEVFKGDNVDLSVPLEVVNTGCFSGTKGEGITDVHIIIVKETKLADRALENCIWKKIVLPEGTTSIGNYSLSECNNITSFTIPSTVKNIGSYAFQNCNKLTSLITTGGSVGNSAFKGCTNLKQLTFDKNTTSIASNIASGCTALTNVTINGATSIGANAFKDCKNLTTVSMGDSGVKSIGDYAFFGCSSLTEIVIPKETTTIGIYAFRGCTGLTKVVMYTQESRLTKISEGMFYDCTGISEINIPASVKVIGYSAFSGCSKLKYPAIGGSPGTGSYGKVSPSLTTIEDFAFARCPMNFINLPETLIKIEDVAFSKCNNLTTINIPKVSGSISGAPWGAVNATVRWRN